MAILDLVIPYPDFKLHETIDPEQFDLNNESTVDKINAILAVLNQITDSVASGGSGADKISITPIAPFTSNKLQAYLKEVIARLTSTTSGASGAGFIGAPAITGVTGTTVSTQLASLKSLFDVEKARMVNEIARIDGQLSTSATNVGALQTRATAVEGRATSLETRMTTNEGKDTALATRATNLETRATNLENGKADKSTTYTKSEEDVLHSGLSTRINTNNASIASIQSQINALNNTYSTDAERVQAIQEVISAYELADEDLSQLILNKADKSLVYSKDEINAMTLGMFKTTTYRNSKILTSADTVIPLELEYNTVDDIEVFVGGTFQTLNVDYTVSNGNIVFSAPLAIGTPVDWSITRNVRIYTEVENADINRAISDSAYAKSEADKAVLSAGLANTKSEQAKSVADGSVSISSQANTKSDLALTRAENIIANAGVQNTEIVDARLRADGTVATTLGTRIREFDTVLADTARQTSTLENGTSVVNASIDSLASAEVEGRTLTSLGNSNLETGKKYVLVDKKTKVVVDGVTQSGVSKFTKGTTVVSTANFVGKVAGSTVANPHIVKRQSGTTLLSPNDTSPETVEHNPTSIIKLDGSVTTTSYSANGFIAKHLFSFDIIAEIERKLGIIPRTTLAEKVQWVKDNVETLIANWHGFGSSVGGNKASFAQWKTSNSSWNTSPSSIHASSTVSNLKTGIGYSALQLNDLIDVNGFYHTLVYAEPSDGTTASTINTDYIELVITLKATAQLNTRPTIIRVENFEGKVSGSTVENPHTIKWIQAIGLANPTSGTEVAVASYPKMAKLDSDIYTLGTGGNTYQAQQLFSFNLIEAVERNIGRIPRATVADKITWLKANVSNLSIDWHGFGSSPTGFKSSLKLWVAWASTWTSISSHSLGTVSNISITQSLQNTDLVDANGIIHFLAHAEASDGTTPSVINTDYIELKLELRPTADFTQPKVPLYEVDDASYSKILVDWNADNVVNRYPFVEGTQHLQGMGVIAEGENLLPPFTEWNLHANAKVISPYELELNATGTFQSSDIRIDVLPNTSYTMSIEEAERFGLEEYDSNGVLRFNHGVISGGQTKTITTQSIVKQLRIYGNSTLSGKYIFKKPMLTLGSTPKPFVPRNPNYLFADVKLGAIGNARDMLYEQDGRWLLRKVVEKDVVLDGSLAWVMQTNLVGFKQLTVPISNFVNMPPNSTSVIGTKYDGNQLKSFTGNSLQDAIYTGNLNLSITVSNSDSGFTDVLIPTMDVIKRYFNGWKYVDGTTWNSLTGNGQTATAQVALDTKPTDYTPYKLSYMLSAPQIIDVTDKVEGALKVGGVTQVEVLSGVVRRERVVPEYNSNDKVYHINYSLASKSLLKNRAFKILQVYKNGQPTPVTLRTVNSYGNERAFINEADFDPTAEYTVTYVALDKQKLTVNPTNVKLTYANSVRNALDDAVVVVQDNKVTLSNHEKAIIDLYVRLIALEGV